MPIWFISFNHTKTKKSICTFYCSYWLRCFTLTICKVKIFHPSVKERIFFGFNPSRKLIRKNFNFRFLHFENVRVKQRSNSLVGHHFSRVKEKNERLLEISTFLVKSHMNMEIFCARKKNQGIGSSSFLVIFGVMYIVYGCKDLILKKMTLLPQI